jgi:hypothetical protein
MAPSGVEFNLLRPDPATIHIEDIAHHLSQICRFTGGTRVHYSVAQHCVLACELAPAEWKLAALLHDAAEAYIGDVSSPVKSLIGTAYAPLEERILRAVFEKFGISALFAKKLPMVVKRIDRLMLEWEQRDLLPDVPWWPKQVHPELAPILPWNAHEARFRFLDSFARLTAAKAA